MRLSSSATSVGLTREDYRIGVPARGRYDEIFSTDAVRFGGKGTENTRIYTKQTPMHAAAAVYR